MLNSGYSTTPVESLSDSQSSFWKFTSQTSITCLSSTLPQNSSLSFEHSMAFLTQSSKALPQPSPKQCSRVSHSKPTLLLPVSSYGHSSVMKQRGQKQRGEECNSHILSHRSCMCVWVCVYIHVIHTFIYTYTYIFIHYTHIHRLRIKSFKFTILLFLWISKDFIVTSIHFCLIQDIVE